MNKTLPLGPAIESNAAGDVSTITRCIDLLETVAPKSAEPLKTRRFKSFDSALKAVTTQLNRHVPPFTYFGYQPNSMTLGVWVDLGRLHQAEESGQLVQAGSDWRGLKAPYILTANEDGKLVLYRRRGRREVWIIP